jgi:1-acyl-sn-glycerol-3-phosphate acyltransferase
MDVLSRIIAARWQGASRDYCPRWLDAVAGTEYIPETGPFILVANHISAADALLLLSICYAVRDDRPAVLSKPSGFTGRHRFFYRAIGGISYLDRWEGNEERTAMEQVLHEGRPLLIFPEGTRGPGGELLPFQEIAFSVAARFNVPIVPAGLVGTAQILPKGKIMPASHQSHRAMLAFGPPIELDRRMPRNARKLALLRRSRAAIEGLLGQLREGRPDVTADGGRLAGLAAALAGRLSGNRAQRRRAWERIYLLLSLARVNNPAMLDQAVIDTANRVIRPLTRPWAVPRLERWVRHRDMRALRLVSPASPGWPIVSCILRMNGRAVDAPLADRPQVAAR